MGGLKGVSNVPAGTVCCRHGAATATGGMLAITRGNSGKQPVPRHAEMSQVWGTQQSQGC